MTVGYQLFVILYEEGKLLPGGREFLDRYSAFRQNAATIFAFQDQQVAMEALALATSCGRDAQLFYIVQLAPEEAPVHPGFYFSLKIGEEILHNGKLRGRHLKKVDLAEDFSTEFILVDERVKRLLLEHTAGVETLRLGETGGRSWHKIESLTRLPEPIYIPQPTYFKPNVTPPGTFAVQSDGRDVLTSANQTWLKEHGLAVSHEVKTPMRQVKWRPRVLASGKLLASLKAGRVRGLVEPFVPLISEGQLFSPS
jgi:hypothetical protein